MHICCKYSKVWKPREIKSFSWFLESILKMLISSGSEIKTIPGKLFSSINAHPVTCSYTDFLNISFLYTFSVQHSKAPVLFIKKLEKYKEI